MSEPEKYLAASIPRSLRLTRSGLFPASCIIGTLVMKGNSNASGDAMNIIRDVVMLPTAAFQRMKANMGVNVVSSPALRIGADFTPGFVFTDIREVVVPAEEQDPYSFAKNYFLEKFGIMAADDTNDIVNPKNFSNKNDAARAYELAQSPRGAF